MYRYTFFLTLALVGEWSPSCYGCLTPGTHWKGGWLDLRAALDDVEKSKFLILLTTQVIQPGASRYTHYIIPVSYIQHNYFKSNKYSSYTPIIQNMCSKLSLYFEEEKNSYFYQEFIHIFLTSALVGGEWSASRPGRLTPRKELLVPIV
jgi:hypothetical protein